VASVRLRDDTLFQVGMSTERRRAARPLPAQVLLLNFAAIPSSGWPAARC
jgi:hypothetical protein